MKKNTKNKISQIDKILMSNKKQNIITAFSMILLAIFAPLKSFVAQWLIDSPSIKAICIRNTLCFVREFKEYVVKPDSCAADGRLAVCIYK